MVHHRAPVAVQGVLLHRVAADDLFNKLQAEWNKLHTANSFVNLLDSMPARCQAVIKAKGGLPSRDGTVLLLSQQDKTPPTKTTITTITTKLAPNYQTPTPVNFQLIQLGGGAHQVLKNSLSCKNFQTDGECFGKIFKNSLINL